MKSLILFSRSENTLNTPLSAAIEGFFPYKSIFFTKNLIFYLFYILN
jgi:hypothetical protein